MSITENTTRRLVLISGSTSLTLDKEANKATLQRKILFWKLSPTQSPLSEIMDVSIDKMVDRASGVEMYSTMIVTRAGAGWSPSARDKSNAESNAATLREFLELK